MSYTPGANGEDVDAQNAALSSYTPESVFTATPINLSTPNARTPAAARPVISFMQNHAANQRSPATVKDHAVSLSRSLSVKSTGSVASNDPANRPDIFSTIDQAHGESEEVDRGRGLANSNSSDLTPVCGLSKSTSIHSAKSAKSVASYQSLRGIGTYEVGTLRVHSPSPTRPPPAEHHPILKWGDIFVVRGMPVGVTVGFDAQAIEIRKEGRFEGLKNITAGTHLIWVSSNISSHRTGYWIITKRKGSDEYGETIVKHWDSYNETLLEESAAEARIQRQSIPEFVDKLYFFDVSHATVSNSNSSKKVSDPELWPSLTSCIKGALLTKITGQAWNEWQVSSSHEENRPGSSSSGENKTFKKDDVLAFIFPKDSRSFSTTSVGRERTEQALDTTSYIKAIIKRCPHEDEDLIIGEMQFSYLTGMHLGNSACMEHWAHIVKTVFKAFRLALELPTFVEKFITAFHAQLAYDDCAFNESILDIDTGLPDELKGTLTKYKSLLTEQLLAQGNSITDEKTRVGAAFEKLEGWLWKWDWDLRGNYLRKGNFQLEDGTVLEDLELSDMEAEDERGRKGSKSESGFRMGQQGSRFRMNSEKKDKSLKLGGMVKLDIDV